MHLHKSSQLLALLCITLMFGACHSTPEQARYIPKEALGVLAINFSSIAKEVAWSKITGSKILDDLEKSAKGKKTADALKDIQNSGIDFMSTVYVYTKTDTRFSGRQRVTALAPLKDKGKWEAWLKKVYPEVAIHTTGNRSEALLDGEFYASWDGDILMVMNCIMQESPRILPPSNPNDSTALMAPPVPDYSYARKADEPATAAEMELAFKLPKDASIAGDKHFNMLMKEGHDVAFFVNYDEVMNSTAAFSGGMGMAAGIYKGTALTGGFDFSKGAIDGTMKYYVSDSMRDVAKEVGERNFDGDMAARLPGQNLNMAAGYHLSPKAVKMVLDKMNYTGTANMTLGQKGFSVDNILSAFTGDIALTVNNFTMVKEMRNTDAMAQAYGMAPYESPAPKADYLVALKIGDKAAFDHLFSYLTSSGLPLVQSSPGTYTIPQGAAPDNSWLRNFSVVVTDKYVAAGNNPAIVQAFIRGDKGNLPEPAKKELEGHPVGFYTDAQSIMQGGASIVSSPSDSMAFSEVKKLFADFGMGGGEYKDGANDYHFTLRMVDKSENSLLQIIQFVERMQAMSNGAQNMPI